MDRTAPTINTGDPVIAEGVRAVLLACSMLQRIGERLATERALRLTRDTFHARAEDTGPSPFAAPGVGESVGAQTPDALTHASDTETPDIQGETRIGRAEAERWG